jgi:hypothetical protein
LSDDIGVRYHQQADALSELQRGAVLSFDRLILLYVSAYIAIGVDLKR